MGRILQHTTAISLRSASPEPVNITFIKIPYRRTANVNRMGMALFLLQRTVCRLSILLLLGIFWFYGQSVPAL